MKFVIFHGAFGSPESNWFPELKEKLENLRQEVIAIQFPIDSWDNVTELGENVDLKNQNLQNWLTSFEKKILIKLRKNDKLCFIGHSLGAVMILHVVDKYNIHLDSAIFVSPFFDRLNSQEYWQFDHANKTFYKSDFDFDKLKKLIPVSYVLYSESDPYVSKSHPLLFSKALDSSFIMVKNAGHLNSEVNMNEFPLVFNLCLTRLDLPLYQRYLSHLGERYATDFLKKKYKKIIYLKPADIFDEGRFHYGYLKHNGFCTYLTGTFPGEPDNIYFQNCRKVARRLPITRVFLMQNFSDLEKPLLQKQIKLDITGGVKVNFCMYEDIIKYRKELDFGIWDERYLCTIRYDRKNKIKDIIVDSRDSVLKEAYRLREIILKRSTRIIDQKKDIDAFIKAHKK